MKAKLPTFSGTTKCQLCHMSEGTLSHRHGCPVTLPSAGWTPFDSKTQEFVHNLADDRARALQTRATLMVSIPIAEPQVPTNGWFWLTDPPNQDMEDLTWVIDGSRRYASHWTLATTGCGVAVLDTHGKLIAYATATPPPWVKTAGAAEAWALFLTLKENPTPPRIITDCLALLHAARAGPTFAARAKNTDARIWKLVTKCTGGCYKVLAASLIWMPSHTSTGDGSYRVMSNGRTITTAQWRANQLADSLAKRGALISPLREEADKVIKVAGEAILQSASRLGVVTLASNVHRIEGVKLDGTAFSITKRDSSTMPLALAKLRAEGRQLAVAAVAAKQPVPPAPLRTAQPLAPLTVAQERSKRRRTEDAAAQLAENLRVEQLATATAARGTVQPELAADRLAALRRRVLHKNAEREAGASPGQ